MVEPLSPPCIAWFRIAESLGVKDRERAFVHCKLLSHSVNSPAFCSQMFGDIHAAFQEYPSAIERYISAFFSYEACEDVHGMSLILLRIASLDVDQVDALMVHYLPHVKKKREYLFYCKSIEEAKKKYKK